MAETIPYLLLGDQFKEKKAFLSDQCKEIEENDTMGKTRDLEEN